jgi:hypothetical protein
MNSTSLPKTACNSKLIPSLLVDYTVQLMNTSGLETSRYLNSRLIPSLPKTACTRVSCAGLDSATTIHNLTRGKQVPEL